MRMDWEIDGCVTFEWDAGNSSKNWERHQVSNAECEEVFFRAPFIVALDSRHSQTESRYYGLGQTAAGRRLFVVFTVRGDRIRVISARSMSRHERSMYEQKGQRTDPSAPDDEAHS